MKRLMDGLDDLAGLDIVLARANTAVNPPRSGLLAILRGWLHKAWTARRMLPTA